MTGDSHTEITVEVYTRPALLLEPVDAKIETLQDLEGDVVDDVALHTWPGEVTRTDDGMYDDVEETFREFLSWAEANDVSIRPPFSVRTRRSRITGETGTVLVPPVMSLAVYLDDRLGGVFPHSDGTVNHPVSEAISALKTGELPTRQTVPTDQAPDADRETPTVAECDSCGGPLVNVQGLLSCHDCLESEPPDRRDRPTQRVKLSSDD